MTSHEEETHLPLIGNPVQRRSGVDSKRLSHLALAPLATLPGIQGIEPHVHKNEYVAFVQKGSLEDEAPEFHRHKEATNAELFYDLFFVANLTVFSYVHDVNDIETLSQYAGFFVLLWFTWFQVALYDVRFSADSLVERVFKALHFGVMIGFAAVGPRFKVESREHDPYSANFYGSLTLLLMASRLVLVLQHASAVWFTRKHRDTSKPLALISAVYAVAAAVYLCLYWSFPRPTSSENPLVSLHENDPEDSEQMNHANVANRSYIVWYVVAILETMAMIYLSMLWRRTIGFKGTHLVQRMTLLTLIILGEGLIGISKQSQSISQYDFFSFHPSNVATLICAVLIFYFVYMLYFDWIEEHHFGSIRQQIWALLHFPLHLSLALAIEGVNQCILWRAATVATNELHDLYENEDLSSSPPEVVANRWNYTTNTIVTEMLSASKGLPQILEGIKTLNSIPAHVETLLTGDDDDASAARDWLYRIGSISIWQAAGYGTQKNLTEANYSSKIGLTDEALEKKEDKTKKTFQLAFVYLMVCMGCVVLLCTLLAVLSKRGKKTIYHWIALGFGTAVGVTLCLMALLAEEGDGDFIGSPWVLPTVAAMLFLAVAVGNLKPSRSLASIHDTLRVRRIQSNLQEAR